MENQSENNDIDDVIVPTAPLYKQILNLYAEENAIEDTIFYLGEALRRGVIDLEVFLKVIMSTQQPQILNTMFKQCVYLKQHNVSSSISPRTDYSQNFFGLSIKCRYWEC